MAYSKRARQRLAAIDDLFDAVKGADEDKALACVAALPKSGGDDVDDDAWRLVMEAIDKGWGRLALAMIQEDKAGGMELDVALDHACESGIYDSYQTLSAPCDRYELLRGAYRAQCGARLARDEGAPTDDFSSIIRDAIARADHLRMIEWDQAREEGLDKRWSARPRLGYEQSCEAWSVPLWSASAAEPILSEELPDQTKIQSVHALGDVESITQHGSALDLPSDFLLWGPADVRSLVSECAQRNDDALWRPELLVDMADSWRVARKHIDSIKSAVERAHDGRAPDAQKLAAKIEKLGIQRWAPFLLAWCAHRAFNESTAKMFEPALRACVIDMSNVGLVAANIDYGSFNARVAVIAMSIRSLGGMDDAAACVISARLEDMASNPVLAKKFVEMPFGPELSKARQYFAAESCRVDMEKDVGHPAATMKKPCGL
jgi:hypothetical protein